jgi:hypothetical protein
VLYLFRRHLQDSGGPARSAADARGARVHRVQKRPTAGWKGCSRAPAEMPNAIGIAEGFPAPRSASRRVLDTDLTDRLARQALAPRAARGRSGPAGDPRMQARALADPRRRGLVSQLAGGRGLRRSAFPRARACGGRPRARRGVSDRGT